jgi:stage IV sporulation protein FB
MVRFTIFGIPVRVEPWFWITLALLGGALDTRTSAEILSLALFLLAGFFSILVHELGHALTARKFGGYSEITLQAFGGYATCTGVRLTRPQDFAVTAAGPFVQIALGLAVFFAFPYLGKLNPNFLGFLFDLMKISIIWAVLNLLPILPLDGGRMLDAVLGPKRIRITLWTTISFAVVVGILMIKYTNSFLFPIFLGMFAWQAWQALGEQRRF